VKEWILRLVAGKAVKNAVAFAAEVVGYIADALQGVLDGDSADDLIKATITAVLEAVNAVKSFLDKLAAILGVSPEEPVDAAAKANAIDKLKDAADRLNGASEKL